MRIDLDHFSFELPSGFLDTTSYSFKARGKREELTTSFGERPSEAKDLATMLTLRKSNIDIMMPERSEIGPDSDTRIDGLPARMTWYRFEDSGTVYESTFAVAFPAFDTYLQISYAYAAKDPQARERFQHILRSVVPARGRLDKPAAPGYVRRWAERMTLEVPAPLAPPRVYQFLSTDGQVHLFMRYFDQQDREPTQAEEIAKDEAVGTMTDRVAVPTTEIGQGKTSMVSYVLTTDEGGNTIHEFIRRAYMTLDGAPHIHLEGRAPLARSAELDTVLNRWIQSFQLR